MTTTQTLRIARFEDHEGDGRCGHCEREGLRWIVRLSDGSGVGTECAKAVLGWKPAPRDYKWIIGFSVVAETVAYGETFAVWQNGARFALTQSGRAISHGPEAFIRAEYARAIR
jgi:hypothetical protein